MLRPRENWAGLTLLFQGSRGRLLAGLLVVEFGMAVQTVAEAAVLPLASRELAGTQLYAATVAGPTLAAIVLILAGPLITSRLSPAWSVALSTVVYVAGVLCAALAPAMGFVLAGRLLQGAAAGLLAGFGLAAIAVLYDDDIRPRVLGLFSAAWLLPSLAGPVLNSIVAVHFGWRWALAWPAVVVIAARILIGRSVTMLPRPAVPGQLPLRSGLLVLVGLIVASASGSLAGAARPAAWSLGLVAALVGGILTLRTLLAGHRRRGLVISVFAGLCVAYFGSEALLPLSVITVAGGGVTGAAFAYAAGATAWSLTGLTLLGPRLKGLAAPLGAAAITTGVLLLTAITLAGTRGPLALTVSITAWAIAGAGIGLSYRTLSSAVFDNSNPAETSPLGSAVAFTETASAAVAALLGTGFYSMTAHTLPATASIGTGYLLTAAVAVAALAGGVILRSKQKLPSPRGSR